MACNILEKLGLSDFEDAVYKLIKDGKAFINPIADKIGDAVTKISKNIEDITDLVLDVPSEIAEEVSTKMVELGDSLTTTLKDVTGFKEHTDRLSGQTIKTAGGSTQPNLSSLMSIASGHARINATLHLPSDNVFPRIFGSILSGDIIIKSLGDIALRNIRSELELEVMKVSGNVTLLIQSRIDELSKIALNIQVQIAADIQAYVDSLAEVLQYAVLKQISAITNLNECIPSNFIKNIASDAMMNEINKIEPTLSVKL